VSGAAEACPGKQWATLPRRRARCADCGREFDLIGREFGKGWGRTRLPNHKRTASRQAGVTSDLSSQPVASSHDPVGPVKP